MRTWCGSPATPNPWPPSSRGWPPTPLLRCRSQPPGAAQRASSSSGMVDTQLKDGCKTKFLTGVETTRCPSTHQQQLLKEAELASVSSSPPFSRRHVQSFASSALTPTSRLLSLRFFSMVVLWVLLPGTSNQRYHVLLIHSPVLLCLAVWCHN